MRFLSGEYLRERIVTACAYAELVPSIVIPIYGPYHLAASERGEVIYLRVGRHVTTSNSAVAFSRSLPKKAEEAVARHGVILDYLPE